ADVTVFGEPVRIAFFGFVGPLCTGCPGPFRVLRRHDVLAGLGLRFGGHAHTALWDAATAADVAVTRKPRRVAFLGLRRPLRTSRPGPFRILRRFDILTR